MKVLLSWLRDFTPLEGDPVALGGVIRNRAKLQVSFDQQDFWPDTFKPHQPFLPNLAAATKIWRPLFDSEEGLATDALAFLKRMTAQPARSL